MVGHIGENKSVNVEKTQHRKERSEKEKQGRQRGPRFLLRPPQRGQEREEAERIEVLPSAEALTFQRG